MNSMISLSKLWSAIDYYSCYDYKTIDAPMLVDKNVSALTKPKGCKDLYHSSGLVYVASAEQSFLSLFLDGKISDGRYMAITPCIRDEVEDETHFTCFLKLELIQINSKDVEGIVRRSQYVLEDIAKQPLDKEILPDGSIDLMLNGLEVGSYGLRYVKDTPYVYGTGIALPRFDIALGNKK